jgi:very-short-patch-repair endonuclease
MASISEWEKRITRLAKEQAQDPAVFDALKGRRRRLPGESDDCADRLLAEIRRLAPDIPPPQRDRPFLTFRIDLAWELGPCMLAVEVNGGLHRAGGGKHATSRDHQKMRELALAGWRTLVFTASEVRNDPLGCISDIRRALRIFGGVQ